MHKKNGKDKNILFLAVFLCVLYAICLKLLDNHLKNTPYYERTKIYHPRNW